MKSFFLIHARSVTFNYHRVIRSSEYICDFVSKCNLNFCFCRYVLCHNTSFAFIVHMVCVCVCMKLCDCTCFVLTTFWGACVCSDIPMAQFIVNLNESMPNAHKFIVYMLDDTHIYVQPNVGEMLTKRLQEFRDQNTYEKPL